MPRSSRRKTLFTLLIILAPASVLHAQGNITVSVFPTLAPNAFGSPSFTPWESNLISALQMGQSSLGDPALPTFYQQIPNGANIPIWIASEFPSWHNLANPGTVFGPAFADELGNRIYFNLHINGNGQQFSISQLSLVAISTDPGNVLGFSVPAGSYNYNSGYVGLNYGGDGMPGGGDDFFVTGGANTQLINELFARGSGNAPGVSNGDPGATPQEKIDNALASLPQNFIFSGTYTLSMDGNDITGNAFVVVGVPEPATWAITILGATAVGVVGYPRWKLRRVRRMRKELTKANR